MLSVANFKTVGFVERRFNTLQLPCETCLRMDKIQSGQNSKILCNRLDFGANQAREFT